MSMSQFTQAPELYCQYRSIDLPTDLLPTTAILRCFGVGMIAANLVDGIPILRGLVYLKSRRLSMTGGCSDQKPCGAIQLRPVICDELCLKPRLLECRKRRRDIWTIENKGIEPQH